MTVSTELAVIHDEGAIDQMNDPEAYVELACQRAKAWLVHALECRDIEQLVELKSRAEAIRIYTNQKALGKDAELSATEIVRRAERAIHLAVNRAREQGEVLRIGQTKRRPGHRGLDEDMMKSLAEVGVARHELSNTVALVKDVSEDEFEEATADARAEKDLSRANLIRKINGKKSAVPLSRRVEVIAELARSGVSSRQIAEKLGVRADRVTQLARDHGIDIPADRIVGRTRILDPTRVVEESVITLQGVEASLHLLTAEDYAGFTAEQAKQWLKIINPSIKCVRACQKELSHRVHPQTSDRNETEEGPAGRPPEVGAHSGDADLPAGST